MFHYLKLGARKHSEYGKCSLFLMDHKIHNWPTNLVEYASHGDA
jgi:hypothetical protein